MPRKRKKQSPEPENKIKAARNKARLTQAEAAERCGWSQSQWAEFEGGRYKSPRLDTYRKAATGLRCKLINLLPD